MSIMYFYLFFFKEIIKRIIILFISNLFISNISICYKTRVNSEIKRGKTNFFDLVLN